MKTPNHALELTAAPTVTTSSMATVSSPHLTLALGGLWVSFFCQTARASGIVLSRVQIGVASKESRNSILKYLIS